MKSIHSITALALLSLATVFGVACIQGAESDDESEILAISHDELTGPMCKLAPGWFCGSDAMTGADAATAYKCTGSGQTPVASQKCQAGCKAAAAGQNDYCNNQSTNPLKVTSGNLAVLQGASYSPSGYLPWASGSMVSAPSGYTPSSLSINGFAGTTFGDGQCVTMVKGLTSTTATGTASWGQGAPVMSSGVAPGTAIATFDTNGKYNSGHAAIFAGYNPSGGIDVFDQNFVGGNGAHRAAKHTIAASGSGVNNANLYYVIKF